MCIRDRSHTERAWTVLCGLGCDRRLSHRNQRHQSHLPAGDRSRVGVRHSGYAIECIDRSSDSREQILNRSLFLPTGHRLFRSALIFSLGVHLVLIFGVLVSPAGKETITAASCSVTVLLRPVPMGPLNATADAAAHQHGGTAPRLSLIHI